MQEFGITDKGFKIKSFQQIRESIKKRLESVYDPDTKEYLNINWEENDPFVQMANSFCLELAQCWSMLYSAYSQFNPLLASDMNLSHLVQLNGLTRHAGKKSKVNVKFTGEPNSFIPQGLVCTGDDGIEWEVVEPDLQIGENGTKIVELLSKLNGAFDEELGAINQMIDAPANLYSVVNEEKPTLGTTDETDEELRIRRYRSTEIGSRGIAESIVSAILALDGVEFAKLYTNRTMQTNELGIPAKSVALVVEGGDKTEIAKTLFNRAGILTGFYGNTTVSFTDSLGFQTDVSFTIPTRIPIYVRIQVASIEGSQRPSDYAEQIKKNIADFSRNGVSALGIETTNNFDTFGFPPSENVNPSRLFTPINAVKGIQVIDLKIGLTNDETEMAYETIEIGWNEVAQFAEENITVITVG